MSIFKINEQENLFYKKTGNDKSDKTFIFIHGSLMNGDQMDLLSERFNCYNCITVDLPGHFRSEGKPKDNVEEITNIIKNLIHYLVENKEATDEIYVLGYSLGGFITLNLGIENIPQVKKLIILNSAGCCDHLTKELVDSMYTDTDFNIDAAIEIASHKTTPKIIKDIFKEEVIKKISREACIADFVADYKFECMDALDKIKVPTLFIAADEDNFFFPEYIIRSWRKIPNAHICMHPNKGHTLYLEATNVVEKDIKDFIENM